MQQQRETQALCVSCRMPPNGDLHIIAKRQRGEHTQQQASHRSRDRQWKRSRRHDICQQRVARQIEAFPHVVTKSSSDPDGRCSPREALPSRSLQALCKSAESRNSIFGLPLGSVLASRLTVLTPGLCSLPKLSPAAPTPRRLLAGLRLPALRLSMKHDSLRKRSPRSWIRTSR